MSSSLGWRTQSTVLPSKAKEIRNVSARSMFDLKAALYAKEEESRRGTRTVRKRKRRVRDDEGLEGQNKGVASRAEKEELEVAQKLSGAALREKSKLYGELKDQARNLKDGLGDEKYMVNFERAGRDVDRSYPEKETMHDKLDEMEKARLEWETETLRRMEEDREDAEKVTSFGKEAYEATEATHRERESKRENADKLEAQKLERLRVLIKESKESKFLDLDELGGVSQEDAGQIARILQL
ncbi:hypothetical protein NDN08_003631 [Rhodosorus marinus]|uniref:Meiosis-specific nuclear structural protein 1 n=1 Tax=Rhodosorus marinus TaxID=101924 RepID=A0AAV8UYM8_9RHOD|nr:hypothetical protein NDN08_003631 [Rhodosorus marinus]